MADFDPAHRQSAYPVRFDWGPTGGAAVAAGVDVAVVVDVLSFSTTVCVALERGITVLPFAWKDERASEYAAERRATLAVGRLEARVAGQEGRVGAVSLSPAAMASVEGVDRVVLPSPNGSTICAGLAESGAQVIVGCMRNRSAVAGRLAEALAAGQRVAVVAAGERWPDGSLRPAAEDLWGAGAVLAALGDLGHGGLSPEAAVAERAFRAVADDVPATLAACASALELAALDFADDVTVAAEVDGGTVVPVLRGGELSDLRR